ncbi:SRPBCC domain-containing protein [Amycolatopsis minnesotensis]|uniref:SRPBCC domain-containing protein n=1 Tax=Amycolatopsis minnesotensis TaxID=337894 RepID=UPI0031DA7002
MSRSKVLKWRISVHSQKGDRSPADGQILIVRRFKAVPRLVYRAWTMPELVGRWWRGHRGTRAEVELDLRVGGRRRRVIGSPQRS